MSLLNGIRFGQLPEDQLQHFSEQLRHIGNNYPHLFDGLRPYARQRKEARRLAEQYGEDFGVFDLSWPPVQRALLLFGAKCGLALHWHEKRTALPPEGRVGVVVFSNEQALRGEVPQHLFQLVPEGKTLQQGRLHVREQFEFASKPTVDGNSTVHWITFGQSIAYNVFVGTNLDLEGIAPDNVFAPGCLRTG